MVRVVRRVVVVHKQVHGPQQKILLMVALHALIQLHTVKRVILKRVLLIV